MFVAFLDFVCTKENTLTLFKSREKKNQRVIDAFRSLSSLGEPAIWLCSTKCFFESPEKKEKKIITVITRCFCHRRYVSKLACSQQRQTSEPWMCLFVYTEGSARHEHQLTGKQRGSTCTIAAPLIYIYIMFCMCRTRAAKGPFPPNQL